MMDNFKEANMNKEEVIDLIDMLGSRIGVPYDSKAYPYVYDSFDKVWNDGRSIYIDDNGDIHVVFFERGKLMSDETDPDPVVALYPVLRGQAAIQAGAYERAHRVEGQDHRRMKFKKELELLNRVLPLYAEMDAKDIHDLLQDNPFMDGKPVGCFLYKYLVRKWFHDAWHTLHSRLPWVMPGGDCPGAAALTIKEWAYACSNERRDGKDA